MAVAKTMEEKVLWLCSPQATYMNGYGLIVDGGIIIK